MCFKKKVADTAEKITITPLTPEVITDKGSQSYKTVREISAAIDHKDVKNIAVTGPYGSGKSSILKTLTEDPRNDRHYLSISLATLKSGIKNKNDNKDGDEQKSDNVPGSVADASIENEELNRKIEYSIVQQLIYRESTDDLPNSRIKKIVHTKPWGLLWRPLMWMGFILALWKLFCPEWLEIESITKTIPIVRERIIDSICLLYVFTVLFFTIRGLIKSYSNSKLNKLNLKDGEIEIKENNSIFNKHLDEIIYFFQATKYNVVIIEDLDRYETTDIFLKLRELNLILNNAYSTIKRKITFIYAIRDDMFKDTDRTKFFDYITTVIPVINYSNSKEKLTKALRTKGYKVETNGDFEIEDIEDIAFFIDDMRLLKNIVNEFDQYWKKLGSNGMSYQLKPSKLLAMITYKNFFPEEFVKLHRREGRVYTCLNNKPQYIEFAFKSIENQIKELDNQEAAYMQTTHVTNSNELRSIYAEKIHELLKEYRYIYIDGKPNNINDILNDIDAFNAIWENGYVICNHPQRSWDTNKVTIDTKRIEMAINKEHTYFDRLRALNNGTQFLIQQKRKLELSKTKIRSLSISELCDAFKIHETSSFKAIGLAEIEEVFIKYGFIGEDYYDYISYFYDDLMSADDHNFILAVKINKSLGYDYHLDKPQEVVKNMRLPLFKSTSILNFDLVDYLISDNSTEDKLRVFIETIMAQTSMKDFLEEYYNNTATPLVLFTKLYSEYRNWLWKHCVNRYDSGHMSLIVAYFRVCDKVSMSTGETQWLDEHFDIIEALHSQMNIEDFNALIKGCRFTNINNKRTDLLDYIIGNCLYQLNTGNLIVISNHLSHVAISQDELTLTRVLNLNNTAVSDYILGHLDYCITQLSNKVKNESPESLLRILNDSSIDINKKHNYLAHQENAIVNISDIEDEDMIDLALDLNIIAGSWENSIKYFSNYNWRETLNKFIANRATEIGTTNLIVSEHIELINHILSNAASPTLKEIAGSISQYDFNELKGLKDFDDKEIQRLLNGGFSTLQMQCIIDLCDIQAISDSVANSTIIAEVYISTPWKVDPDKILAAVGNINKLEIKIKLLTILLKENNNSELITQCITLLPEEYHAIAEKRRQPKIVNNEYNLEFIKTLNAESYISSFSIKDDKIHVVTKYN